MQGSGSRARLSDMKSMGLISSSSTSIHPHQQPPMPSASVSLSGSNSARNRNSAAILLQSASSHGLTHPTPPAVASPMSSHLHLHQSPHTRSATHEQTPNSGNPHVPHSFSHSSLLSSSDSSFQLASTGSLQKLRPSKSYKSSGVACEIRLKEAIERSRVADRLLRSNNLVSSTNAAGVEARTDAEGLVDRSISALALVLFEILHEQKDAFRSASAYTQFVSVLDQLLWSAQTRVVQIQYQTDANGNQVSTNAASTTGTMTGASSAATLAVNRSASSSSLALNKPPPVVVTQTVVERITNYELNLLHARNDENWRANYRALSESEVQLRNDLDRVMKENEELRADMAVFAQETASAKEHQRELERIIQSLDGRLHIAQQEYEKLAAKLSQLQDFSSEQQEQILQSRQETVMVRREAEAAKQTWISNENTEHLQAQVHKSEEAVVKMEEQVSSINKLYYAMMASCHNAIQKKDSIATELEEAKKEIEALTLTKAEILRPYTPRPEWRKIYRSHLCELTPTFLMEAAAPSTQQIHMVLDYLLKKFSEIDTQIKTMEQTLDVQQNLKRDLAKAKRDLEIAIRSGLSAANGRGGNGGNSDETAAPQRTSMSTMYMKPKSTSRYFVAMGNGKEVPPFLRCNGKIRNRHLSKKDTEMVVREVWQRKMAHDKERGRLDLNLSDFFYFFLKNKYGLPSLVAEWGYNMLDALERYRWDADCELFLKILIGEISEEAYYDQLLLMQTLTNLFMQLEIIRSERKAVNLQPGATPAILPMDFISKQLRLIFPYKPDEAFESMMAALAQVFMDSPKALTDYSELFKENRTMNETGFIEEIRDQHLYEIENFMIQFTEEIVLLPREDDPDAANQPVAYGPDGNALPAEGKVRMYDIHNAWIRLDPQVTVETMDKFISRALRLPMAANGVPAVDPTLLVAPNEFCKALFSASLIKYTCNFDPNAGMKVHTIPMPDAIAGTMTTGSAMGATATAGEEKDNSNFTSTSTLRTSRSKAKLERRGTWTASEEEAAALAKATKEGGGAAGGGNKKETGGGGSIGALNAFTNPKVLRLRTRFGLEARPEEIVFLERGPSFQDPSLKNSSEKVVDTLLSEKNALDDARMNEKIRLREAAERSSQAILGIGVINRRKTVVANDSAIKKAAEEAKEAAAKGLAAISAAASAAASPSNAVSASASAVPSESPSVVGSPTASGAASTETTPPLAENASATTASSSPTAVAGSEPAATSTTSASITAASSDEISPSTGSSTGTSPPSTESTPPNAPTTDVPATTTTPPDNAGNPLTVSITNATGATGAASSPNSSDAATPAKNPALSKESSLKVTTEPRARRVVSFDSQSGVALSPGSPPTSGNNSTLTSPMSSAATPSSNTLSPAPVSGPAQSMSTPKYKSSFFAAPEIHANNATHEKPATVGPPGTMKSPNAAFKRRYAERRKSVETGSQAAIPIPSKSALNTPSVSPRHSKRKSQQDITPAQLAANAAPSASK